MSNIYIIPQEYSIHLHHVRPRFKDDIENVLLFMADEIAKLPEMEEKLFNEFFKRIK